MTKELSDFTDSDFPAFPWDDFESIMQMTEIQTNPLDRGAGPSGAVRTSSFPIKHCREFTPFVDTPLSPPPHERGPTFSPRDNGIPPQSCQQLPLSSHIPAISVRMASYCGQPNTALFGDGIVCGQSYEEIKETAVLDYLENTTYLGQAYGERLKSREVYLSRNGPRNGTLRP